MQIFPHSSDLACRGSPQCRFALLLLVLWAAAAVHPVLAQQHAVSMSGEPRYGPGFNHFGYVNPDAPKAQPGGGP